MQTPVFYVDGRQTDVSSPFHYSDRTTVDTTALDWYPGEPNGKAENWQGEKCLCLFTTVYRFGDTSCLPNVSGHSWGYICERQE